MKHHISHLNNKAMYSSFPVAIRNVKGLYLLGLLLITSFSHVEAQGEWKKNSKGHYVYVYKPSSNTPVKITTKPSPVYRKTVPERTVKKNVEKQVDYSLYYDKEVDANGMRIARQAGKWGLMNTNGFYSVPLIYDSILPAGNSKLYPTKKNGKWGFIDGGGIEKVPLIYNAIVKPFGYAGSYATVVEHGRQFEIKENGSVLRVSELTGGYDITQPFSEGLACVYKRYSDRYGDAYWGFIDKKGTVIIPLVYDLAYSFKEGLAYVKAKGGYYGFIDKKGKIIIPLEYFGEGIFSEGLTALTKNGKAGYFDTKGNIILPFIYEDANAFKDGKAVVKQNGERFFIDRSGNRIGIVYDSYEPAVDGLIKVKKGNLYGFIDLNGKEIIPLIYPYASLSGGFILVFMDHKAGIIDKTGKVIIPLIYEDGNWFYEGLVAMRKGKLWGFIDEKGNTAIEFKYTYVKPFKDGIAEVSLNGEIFKINKSGEKVSQ